MDCFSNLAKNIVPSMTVELKSRISELRRQGRDIVGLTSGEPDMDTPAHICEAAKRAMDSGKTKYTPAPGILALREEVCRKLKADHALEYQPDQICVSTGAKQAIFNAVLALCGPGDEVLLPTPCWVSYTEQIKMAGAIPVMVPSPEESGYQLDISRLRAAATDKTKLIIFNNPNNPTGAVYTEDCLKELAEFAEEKGLLVISDEIYEKLIYDASARFISFPTLSQYAKDHTVLINGWSKSYSMTGWRIGFSACPREMAKAISSIQGHVTYNVNSIAQYAALEAFAGPQDCVEEMRLEFDRRRQYVTARLNQMPGITCQPVQGAFYVLPNVSRYYGAEYQGKTILNSLDFCNFMIEYAGVAFVPGESFYAPNAVRISYASSMEDIREAMDRMERGLALLNAKSEP